MYLLCINCCVTLTNYSVCQTFGYVKIIVHVYVCVKLFTFFDLYFVYFLQYSDTVGWVF